MTSKYTVHVLVTCYYGDCRGGLEHSEGNSWETTAGEGSSTVCISLGGVSKSMP